MPVCLLWVCVDCFGDCFGFAGDATVACDKLTQELEAVALARLDKFTQELEAVALARQAQSEADEQAASALARTEQEAAAKARLDKKERKKKEKEDYLAKNAPGPSAGRPAPEVIEANRIAREERLLALAANERRQKEAEAKAEKEAEKEADETGNRR